MSIQRSMMRWLGALSLAVGVATLLSACGGGGGDSGSTSTSSSSTPSQLNLTATVTGQNGAQTTESIVVQSASTLFATGGYALPNLAGPFGKSTVLDFGLPHFYGRTIYFGMDQTGSGGASPYIAPTNGVTSGSSGASNQVPVTVAAGVAGIVNMPTVSVTICAPGTLTCQTIDNVLVDTASYGVRIMSSAASSVLSSLPTQTANVGGTLAECGQFVSSYTWGTVRKADVKVGGEIASSLPIQILGDFGTAPSTCSNGTASANSPSALGANGILGIGPAPYDCGTNPCATSATSMYWGCSGSSCQESTATLAQQVANPVPHFADNNGVIVSMNTPSGGTATGTLIFGIGTQSNNALPSSATKLTSTTTGDVTASFLGRSITDAFFDTGSNGYFFDDSSLKACSGNESSFYCL